jgi:hypothetical protein
MINVIFGRSYVFHNDTMYYVVRLIKEHHNPIIETWKEHLMCDTVLKKDGIFYFCQKVIEPEVIYDSEI